jgi:hypothetical protein
MAMRVECKNFESRTYANGETVRKCNLDLAPEAPWRCPDDCPKYERRMADAAWAYGTAVVLPTPDQPIGEGIAELLDEAENVVNAVGPEILAEIRAADAKRAAAEARSWRRFLPGRRKKR